MNDLKKYLTENPTVLDDMLIQVPGYGKLKYKQVVSKIKEMADDVSEMAKKGEFEKLYHVLEKGKLLQAYLNVIVNVNKQVQ